MSSITKLYHRGRRFNRPTQFLTAVLKITLDVGNSKCESVSQPIVFQPGFDPFLRLNQLFVPDFTDGPEFEPFEEIPTVEPENDQGDVLFIDREGVSSRPPLQDAESVPAQITGVPRPLIFQPIPDSEGSIDPICIGFVSLKLTVDISSPLGKGNGDNRIGPMASQFGLVYAAMFNKFQGGSLAPNAEHWRVFQTIPLSDIPCRGGQVKDTVMISQGVRAIPDLKIDFDVNISKCGTITKEDFTLKLGGIGNNAPVKEVKPGGALGFPLKNAHKGANYIVGSSGQPARLV